MSKNSKIAAAFSEERKTPKCKVSVKNLDGEYLSYKTKGAGNNMKGKEVMMESLVWWEIKPRIGKSAGNKLNQTI